MAEPDVGVMLPTMSKDLRSVPANPAATARHAEDLGFESAWVIDQVIAGSLAPLLDSGIALAAAAATTDRIRLGYGVMVLPLRPAVWAAKQVASLQHVSGDRVLLGVGIGAVRHDHSWRATGVPRRERGRRADAALRVLPDLIAGRPVDLDGAGPLHLSPAATVPPILVGGLSDAALRRTIAFGDGWLAPGLGPEMVAGFRARLAEMADAAGRPAPSITVAMLVAATGDPTVPDHDAVIGLLTDPKGAFGMPPQVADGAVVHGGPEQIADRIAALADAGASRVLVDTVTGDWRRQAELIAAAHALL